jgi:hypothetical protein
VAEPRNLSTTLRQSLREFIAQQPSTDLQPSHSHPEQGGPNENAGSVLTEPRSGAPPRALI